MGIYRDFQILDPGEVLVAVVGEIAGGNVAAAVESEVQRLRRSDGSIVSADLSALKKEKHSPLSSLGGLLAFEEMGLSVWAESGFGMLQKRSAGRQVKQVWRDQGLDAAVAWVLANAKRSVNLDILRHLLEQNASSPMGDLEEAFRRNLAKGLRKWR